MIRAILETVSALKEVSEPVSYTLPDGEQETDTLTYPVEDSWDERGGIVVLKIEGLEYEITVRQRPCAPNCACND